MVNISVNMGGVNKKETKYQETFSNCSATRLLPVSYALCTANEKTVVPVFSRVSEMRIVKMMRAQVYHRQQPCKERAVSGVDGIPEAGSWTWGTCCRALEKSEVWERLSGLRLQLAVTRCYGCSALREQSSDNCVALAGILLSFRASQHYCCYSAFSSLWLCDSQLLSSSSSVQEPSCQEQWGGMCTVLPQQDFAV